MPYIPIRNIWKVQKERKAESLLHLSCCLELIVLWHSNLLHLLQRLRYGVQYNFCLMQSNISTFMTTTIHTLIAFRNWIVLFISTEHWINTPMSYLYLVSSWHVALVLLYLWYALYCIAIPKYIVRRNSRETPPCKYPCHRDTPFADILVCSRWKSHLKWNQTFEEGRSYFRVSDGYEAAECGNFEVMSLEVLPEVLPSNCRFF